MFDVLFGGGQVHIRERPGPSLNRDVLPSPARSWLVERHVL